MYIATKVFPVNRADRKKEFATITFNLEDKVFIVYIVFISKNSNIYPFCKAQIAFLKTNETFTSILSKYVNFVDFFSENLVIKLSDYIRINFYIIDLIKS